MTRIKFCGLTRPEDIDIVNKLKPDYIGFVFYTKSKRNLTPEKAAILKQKLDDKIQAVGVFVDEDMNKIAKLVNDNVIDIIQLHGSEDETYIEDLRKITSAKIIKAFQIKQNVYEGLINESSADMVLVDSGQGTGKAFDWNILSKIKRPFILAGGLNPENVKDAILNIKPYGIDLSSGIETDGIKDEAKMEAIMTAKRETSSQLETGKMI
ncbi:phosphoribosylanthranilate isomerase [Butyrivibrio sp. JL13D10]|uniref:phosphoribosylanthranilate isomerase n=1 Tax=Butyrivibrio sp. JL13D10 TaxID=3236815 RepID=UPI0038B64F91